MFDTEHFKIPDGYFEQPPKKTLSLFGKRTKDILKAFSQKWHPTSAKDEYLSTFSIASWKRLKTEDKTRHTLVDCVACYESHRELQ